MQKSGVDYLPIKWQPALEELGKGGSAGVSQALINIGTSFAFKRLFFHGLNEEKCYERLGKEALILRHVHIINHQSFIRLEAYCCEILKEPERISPVLTFEKFPWATYKNFCPRRNPGTLPSKRGSVSAQILRVLSRLYIDIVGLTVEMARAVDANS